MVNKTANGYQLQRTNGEIISLSKQEAYEIMYAAERSFDKEDIMQYMDDNDLGIDSVTEAEVEDLCDLYADAKADNSNWYDILDIVVKDYFSERLG